MAKKTNKPGECSRQQNLFFSWDSFIRNLIEGEYILVLGSEIMLSKSLEGNYNGDSYSLIFDDVKESLVSSGILSGNNASVNFTQLSYIYKNIDTYIRKSVNENLEFKVEEIEPRLVELMKTRHFRVVLTTTFDPYALELMEHVWGKGNVRVMNINNPRSSIDFDLERYISDDITSPIPPTLYYIFGKAFPAEETRPFVVNDNDAIVTLSKWMGESAPEKMLKYIRSKRILALGCKFDDWFFRFFWYTMRKSIIEISNGEVVVSLDEQSESDRKLKQYFDNEKIYYRPDARKFIEETLERLDRYDIKEEIISKRKRKGVFLSYAHEDFEIVRHIFLSLVKAGIDVWFDERNLQGGDKYEEDIPAAIADSRIFIPILSSQAHKDIVNSNRRYYKDVEWSTTQTMCNTNTHYKVVPVRLPGYDTRSQANNDGLPPCMRTTIFDLEKCSVNELVTRINELLKQ